MQQPFGLHYFFGLPAKGAAGDCFRPTLTHPLASITHVIVWAASPAIKVHSHKEEEN